MTNTSILWQCGVAAILLTLAVVLGRLRKTPEGYEPFSNAVAVWCIAGFALVNPVAGIWARHWLSYTGWSLAALLGLIALSVLLIQLVSEGGLDRMRRNTVWYVPIVFLYPALVGATALARLLFVR